MPSADFYSAARAVVAALGVTPTDVSINLVVAWMWAEKPHGEGAGWQWNNPMNTTLNRPGAEVMNSAGVKAYPTREVGAEANAATIRGSYYPTLAAALERGDAALFFSPQGIRQLSIWVSGDPDANPGYGAEIRQIYENISGDAIPPAAVVPGGPPVAVGAVSPTSWGKWLLGGLGAAAMLFGVVELTRKEGASSWLTGMGNPERG